MLDYSILAKIDWDFVFTGIFQTLVVVGVAFVVSVLLVSHLRYEKLTLSAIEGGDERMNAEEAFRIRVATFLGGLHRQPEPFSVVLFTLKDIDRMRETHSEEDLQGMMQFLMEELGKALRTGDALMLYEEVYIGLVARIEREFLDGLLERLNKSAMVEAYRMRDGQLKKLKLNIGVSTFPENGLDVDSLMDAATEAREQVATDPERAFQISDREVVREQRRSDDDDDDDEEEEGSGRKVVSDENGAENKEDAIDAEADGREEGEREGDDDEPEPEPKKNWFGFLTASDEDEDEDEDEESGGTVVSDENDAENEEDSIDTDDESEPKPKKRWFGFGQASSEDEDEGEGDSLDDEDDDDEDDEEELSAAQARLVDELTGVLGENYSGGATQKYIARYRKDEHPVSLLYVDVDGLDQYNTHYGRKAGDAILRCLGEVLQEKVREGDIIGRVGGEEFVVCMATRPTHALAAAKRLCTEVKKASVTYSGNKLKFTVCIGVAGFPDHGGVARSLWERAMIAMRAAKYRGRSMYEVYHPKMRSSTIREQETVGPTDAF